MLVINLFGGPGSGKSTLAATIYSELKRTTNYKCELVTEVAKDIVWEGNYDLLKNQLYVTAAQNRKLENLRNKVDIAIVDSPLLIGINYDSSNYPSFPSLVFEIFNSYTNINYFLDTNENYEQYGRIQSHIEALDKSQEIKEMLEDNQVPFVETFDMDKLKSFLSEKYKYYKLNMKK
jgi:DNA replication protein DnaC